MKSELLSQRNYLAYFTPQTLGMFELGKITCGIGQINIVLHTTIYKADRKAGIPSMRTSN